MKKFKVKRKKNCFDRFMIGLFKLFKGKHKIVNLNQEPLPEKCILLANHSNSGGPINYSMYFSGTMMMWGAHQMTENFKSRWNYSYHIFYRQKLGYGKFRSWIIATLLAIIAPLAYSVPGIIPVYYDMRVMQTFRNSIQCLNENKAVLIFPENSNEGYKDQLLEINPGFLELSKMYFKRCGIDLPIYPLRLDKKPKRIVIGKPLFYQELSKTFSDTEIIEIFRNSMNVLKSVGFEPVLPASEL